MALAEERERARSLATRIVSFAIGLVGLVLIAFAVVLVIQGGGGLLLLAILLFFAGIFIAAIGFFFQLVPFRLDELAGMKREYDARVRDARPDERRPRDEP
jgi:fatty acid desaturase